MIAAGHLNGGGALQRKLKLGASVVSVGVPLIDGTAGVLPCTTTDGADTPGLGLDTGTYSTAQGSTHAEGLVTCSMRPDLIIKALMSGGATEGTALPLLTNTAASTDGTTVSDATNVGTASMATGTLWCIKGANVGQSRVITTFNSATSEVVTVSFLQDIAVGDQFLQCPWSVAPVGAGGGNVQTTTLFTQADATIVAGTGLVAAVVDLELNGRTDSAVLFIMPDHVYNVATL
jgi:hypothetical protein